MPKWSIFNVICGNFMLLWELWVNIKLQFGNLSWGLKALELRCIVHSFFQFFNFCLFFYFFIYCTLYFEFFNRTCPPQWTTLIWSVIAQHWTRNTKNNFTHNSNLKINTFGWEQMFLWINMRLDCFCFFFLQDSTCGREVEDTN